MPRGSRRDEPLPGRHPRHKPHRGTPSRTGIGESDPADHAGVLQRKVRQARGRGILGLRCRQTPEDTEPGRMQMNSKSPRRDDMSLGQAWSRISRAAFAFAVLAGGAARAAADLPYTNLQELKAKYQDKDSKFATINGLTVHYKDEGKGPAIMMIHGSSSTLHTYDVIADKLKGRYRIIRFDIPPLGLSGPVTDEDVNRVTDTDLPAKLLEQLGVKSTDCVGVSSGGTHCIYLAARYPDLVNHLIISNSPSDPVENARPIQSKGMIESAKETRALNGFRTQKSWDTFFTFFSGEPERITPQIRERYYDFNRRLPDKNIIALASKVANHELALDMFSRVKIPVLLVWGARDPLLTPPSADVLAGYLRNADVSKIMLPDVGHYPPLEIPERYAQIIAAYLEAATPVRPKSPDPKDR
ncbi:MAG: alpha/beta hydrolase [Rhodospirillaceae bacterium]|nr:alpha/beta hydrolase [Rhodospirillaceae bacterium]